MNEHTKEPWKVNVCSDGEILICGAEGRILLQDENENAIGDAKRVVACVNACVGIPNSVLAVFTQPECNILVSNGLVNDQLKKVTAQRDELLAALDEVVNSLYDDEYKLVYNLIKKFEAK